MIEKHCPLANIFLSKKFYDHSCLQILYTVASSASKPQPINNYRFPIIILLLLIFMSVLQLIFIFFLIKQKGKEKKERICVYLKLVNK